MVCDVKQVAAGHSQGSDMLVSATLSRDDVDVGRKPTDQYIRPSTLAYEPSSPDPDIFSVDLSPPSTIDMPSVMNRSTSSSKCSSIRRHLGYSHLEVAYQYVIASGRAPEFGCGLAAYQQLSSDSGPLGL